MYRIGSQERADVALMRIWGSFKEGWGSGNEVDWREALKVREGEKKKKIFLTKSVDEGGDGVKSRGTMDVRREKAGRAELLI